VFDSGFLSVAIDKRAPILYFVHVVKNVLKDKSH
jgi:hypothetical protein